MREDWEDKGKVILSWREIETFNSQEMHIAIGKSRIRRDEMGIEE